MTLELSADQLQAVQRGEAVRLSAGGLGQLVVLQADAYEELLHSERDKAAWASVAKRAAEHWAQENPF